MYIEYVKTVKQMQQLLTTYQEELNNPASFATHQEFKQELDYLYKKLIRYSPI